MLNITPNSLTGARTPREIITGKVVDFNHDLKAPFGTFAHFKVPNQTGTTDAKTEVGLIVGRNLNNRGQLRVLLLDSLKFVSRDYFRPVPATPDLISLINNIANDQLSEVLSPEQIVEYFPNYIGEVPDTDPVDPNEHQDHDHNQDQDQVNDAIEVEPQTTYPNVPNVPVSIHSNSTETANATPDSPARSGGADVVTLQEVNNTSAAETGVDKSTSTRVSTRQNKGTTSRYNDYDRHKTKSVLKASMTLKEALQKYDSIATKSALDELQQLINRKVWRPLQHRGEARKSKHTHVISSNIFVVEKFLANGSFEKLKSRLVAGGHRTDANVYDDGEKNSPTVSTESFFAIAGIAAYERRKVEAIDFPGAYLNANLADTQLMYLQKEVVEILISMQPELKAFKLPDGRMLVEVMKALYGLPEASKLWYELLSSVLQQLGYKQSPADPCVFNRRKGEQVSTLCVHVDDVFHTYIGDNVRDELISALTKRFGELKIQKAEQGNLSYLGLNLNFSVDKRSVLITQPGYVAEMLKLYEVSGYSNTPATNQLFNEKEYDNPNVKPTDQKDFLSKVMKLMFLAKRTRPDILLAVSYLSTRASNPNEYDEKKLDKVLKYLNATQELGITMQPESLNLYASIDASYGTHSDGKGHSGVVITLGKNGAPIHVSSRKQKLVSRSSTESELIGLDGGVSTVIWLRTLMESLGCKQPTTIVYQDNTSAMTMSNQGRGGKTSNSKHINIRYNFIKQHIDNRDIILEYQSTKDIIADMFTKPISGNLYSNLRDKLLGV